MNTIFECSYFSFGWEIGHPLCMYVIRGMEGSKMCTECKWVQYLFLCSCLMMSCFICRNLTLSSFKKDVFVRNGYFSSTRSKFCYNEISFFYFKLLFRTKVSQNAFNFAQVHQYFTSIFEELVLYYCCCCYCYLNSKLS